MAYIQGESRSQTSLFPASLEELIPEDHLVRVIDLYVAKLDLGQLGFEKLSPRPLGALHTTPPISSNSTFMAISSAFARPGVWKPSASATSK